MNRLRRTTEALPNKARAGRLRALAAGLLLLSGASAFASQVPEAFYCTDENGENAARMVGGDVKVPRCDDENMGPAANTVHDIGKGIAIGSFAGSGLAYVRSRRYEPAAETAQPKAA